MWAELEPVVRASGSAEMRRFNAVGVRVRVRVREDTRKTNERVYMTQIRFFFLFPLFFFLLCMLVCFKLQQCLMQLLPFLKIAHNNAQIRAFLASFLSVLCSTRCSKTLEAGRFVRLCTDGSLQSGNQQVVCRYTASLLIFKHSS